MLKLISNIIRYVNFMDYVRYVNIYLVISDNLHPRFNAIALNIFFPDKYIRLISYLKAGRTRCGLPKRFTCTVCPRRQTRACYTNLFLCSYTSFENCTVLQKGIKSVYILPVQFCIPERVCVVYLTTAQVSV